MPTVNQAEIEYDEFSVQGTVSRMLHNAVSFHRDNIEESQKDATDYYMGRPLGNEEVGRSTQVSTDVRDATLSQLPSLLRIFLGSDKAVEFLPDSEYEVHITDMQTAYVNYVFTQDNSGFMTLYSVFMDALVRRVGFAKWWWEDGKPEGTTYYQPSEAHRAAFIADESVEKAELLENGNVEVTWIRRGKIRVEAVPPEEIVFTPHARNFDDAAVVAHVRLVPADELVNMGYDREIVEGYTRTEGTPPTQFNALEIHRQVTGQLQIERDIVDRSQLPVLFAEAYAMVDVDEDGIAELRKFHCMGDNYTIVNTDDDDHMGELVSHIPFAVCSPILEPHTIIGLSNYDLLKDIQKVKSQLERRMLDSLSRAVDPQMEIIDDNILNYEDLLSTELSNFIRVTERDSVREIPTVFLGPQVLQTIEYYNDKRGDRVGMTRASEGLDPDALQSSTPDAVTNTLTRSRDILEMIARTFGETCLVPMFKGILKMLVEHQDYTRSIQLDGKSFSEIDPRQWHSDREIRINVALGSGTTNMKIANLNRILELQQAFMSVGAPIVSWVEVRNTVARMTDLMGHKDTSQFFKSWTQQDQRQAEQQAQQQAQQDQGGQLEQMLVQVEREKNMGNHQLQLMKLRLDYQKAMMDNNVKEQKVIVDAIMKELGIEAEFGVKIEDQAVRERVERERTHLQLAGARAGGTNGGGAVGGQ